MRAGVRRFARGVMGRPLWLAGVAASAGAGIVHLAHGPAHLAELGALGAGFYLAAALQIGWAAVAIAWLAGSRIGSPRRAVPALAASGIAINGAILAAWAVSRVVGLPAGEAPWKPEAIGAADGISSVLEGLLVMGLIAALRGWTMPRLPHVHGFATTGAAIAILLIATGTAVAVTPSAAGHAHPPGYEHEVMDDDADANEHSLSDGHDGDLEDEDSDHHGAATGS